MFVVPVSPAVRVRPATPDACDAPQPACDEDDLSDVSALSALSCRGRPMSAIRSRAAGDGEARSGVPGTWQVRRLPFGTGPGAVTRARTFLRTAMQAYGWRPASDQAVELAADDIVLVAVELVTNACLHGGGPVELRVFRSEGVVRVEVEDRTEERPVPRNPFDGLRTGGHGLLIVRRLSREWGTLVQPGRGKTVWAELAEPGSGAAPPTA